MTTYPYTVKSEPDGFHVYWRGDWGIGYVFTSQALAESAARGLNDNVALDEATVEALTDTPACPVCGSTEPDCEPGCTAVPPREFAKDIAADEEATAR